MNKKKSYLLLSKNITFLICSPTKNDFIRAKYEQLSFVHRPPKRDDEDLGKQLHSSVRTANLDTSLRLLSLGAQANFYHIVSLIISITAKLAKFHMFMYARIITLINMSPKYLCDNIITSVREG